MAKQYKIEVNSFYCKGCGLCIDNCPKSIMALDNNTMTEKGHHPAICTDNSACIGCQTCALMCPDVAITILSV